MMKTTYEVIDDFLPIDMFQEIQSSLKVQTWDYVPNVSGTQDLLESEEAWKYFYMSHHVCKAGMISSSFYHRMFPILEKLDVKALIRIKCNLYPNSEKVHEHKKHIDYDYPHKAAILSLNTCNGYTKLEDGTKIDSIANRILIFDGSKPHSSTTCTNQPVRVNININYF